MLSFFFFSRLRRRCRAKSLAPVTRVASFGKQTFLRADSLWKCELTRILIFSKEVNPGWPVHRILFTFRVILPQ